MVIHRSALIAEGAGASRGVAANPWLINETEETQGLTIGDIKEQQQRIIEGKSCYLKQHLPGSFHGAADAPLDLLELLNRTVFPGCRYWWPSKVLPVYSSP